jgi:hypothetical protein
VISALSSRSGLASSRLILWHFYLEYFHRCRQRHRCQTARCGFAPQSNTGVDLRLWPTNRVLTHERSVGSEIVRSFKGVIL